VICHACKRSAHDECPELKRQLTGAALPSDLAASSLCDCQHAPRSTITADVPVPGESETP